jgi:KaiC/GvpD/RAD55 family RecA-like ATPase
VGDRLANARAELDKLIAAAFPFKRLDDWEVRPRASIVQGIGVDEGAVVALVGAPNAGKTALAVSLALAVASDASEWLGRKVAGGPVVYFAAEAPASVKLRARAAVQRLQGSDDAALYLTDAVPAIGGEATAVDDARRMIATVQAVQLAEERRVALVVLDTVASCLGDGDENGEGMVRLTNAAKLIALQTGACVVLVHHPSKGDPEGLRGHGSLSAACDAIIRVEVEQPTMVRTAILVKARDHATGLQIRFELEPVQLPDRDSFGDAHTSVIVRSSTQAPAIVRPKGKRQGELLTDLERRYRSGERQWNEAEACEAARGLGMHRNSARDAVVGLTKAGYLHGASDSLTLKFPPSVGART